MQFKKIIPYKLRHMLPILGVAGIGAISSCEKHVPVQMPKQAIEINLWGLFPADTMWKLNQQHFLSGLDYFLQQDYIDTIYIVPTGGTNGANWYAYHDEYITDLRKNYIEPLLAKSPKLHGKGNFVFDRPPVEDSLWFVQHGWQINQHRR